MAESFSTRLLRRDSIGGDVVDLDFAIEADAGCRFRAGQFVSFVVGVDLAGQPVRRSYSIASPSDEPGHVRLLVKVLPRGAASDFFLDLPPDARIAMTGPHGFFTLDDAHAGDVIFAATGTGVAPVLPMMRELAAQPRAGRRVFWWGLRTESDLFLRDEVARTCRDTGVDLQIFLSAPSPAWTGARGRITQPVLDAAPSLSTPMFYIVGNGTMIRELKSGLVKQGVDRKKQIRTEAFFD